MSLSNTTSLSGSGTSRRSTFGSTMKRTGSCCQGGRASPLAWNSMMAAALLSSFSASALLCPQTYALLAVSSGHQVAEPAENCERGERSPWPMKEPSDPSESCVGGRHGIFGPLSLKDVGNESVGNNLAVLIPIFSVFALALGRVPTVHDVSVQRSRG